jgi:hypothetical protein
LLAYLCIYVARLLYTKAKGKRKGFGSLPFPFAYPRKTHSRKQRKASHLPGDKAGAIFFLEGKQFPQILLVHIVTTQQILGMLFFLWYVLKVLFPLKRKIKIHDGTQNPDFPQRQTPQTHIFQAENQFSEGNYQ